MSHKVLEDSANLKAAKALSKIIAVVVILVVAAFGDVMYIQAMSSKFPSGGPLLIMCYIGAFTSFLAVMYLLMGKSLAFRPGAQMIGAWVVFVAELLIIGMNILLVFNPHGGGLMDAWAYISPASPVLHMLGVAMLYFLDPDLKVKHDAMEMQEKMNKAEREVEFLTHRARIDLRTKQIGHVSKSLEEAVNSPASLTYIQQYGHKINMELLRDLTGLNLLASPSASQVPGLPAAGSSGSPAPRVVSGNLEAQEWNANDAWLQDVNNRMAAERERRLVEESASADESQMGEYAPVGFDLDRVSRLVSAAEERGYSLEDMERFVGAQSAPGLDMSARLTVLSMAAAAKGYTPEKIERFLGLASTGGDDAKKK